MNGSPAEPAGLSRFARWRDRLMMVGQFATVQVIVQVLGFATGILVVRGLSPHDYAYYTIANGTLGTLNLLADMGIGTAVMALAGKVWQDRVKFGEVVETALRLRYVTAACATLVMGPVMIWLLRKQEVGYSYAALLLALVLVTLFFQLSVGVLGVVPRLHAQMSRLQALDLGTAAARLALTGVLFVTWMHTSAVLFTTTVVLVVQVWVMRRQAAATIDLTVGANPAYRGAMTTMMRSQALYVIYYCFQGQMTFWLISSFGRVESIAQAGALGRLAAVFAVVSSVVTAIATPRFARCNSSQLIRRRFMQITGACCLLATFIVAAAFFFTPEFLWLLGKHYDSLHAEFHLLVMASLVAFIASSLLSLNNARGWVQLSWMHVPTTIAVQIAALAFVDISTLRGVLVFGLCSQCPSLFVNIIISWRGLKRLPVQ